MQHIYSTKMNNLTPKHLGGHLNITHTDSGSLSWIKSIYPNAKTLIDIGCGPGWQVNLANEMGFFSLGIDGDLNCNPDILHDFTLGKSPINKNFDIAWSVEFLEHVEEAYIDNFLSLFAQCNFIVCTASPSKAGYHHVNPQEQIYWVEKFKHYGLEFSDDLSLNLRKNSTMKRDFIRERGMVFLNKNRDFKLTSHT